MPQVLHECAMQQNMRANKFGLGGVTCIGRWRPREPTSLGSEQMQSSPSCSDAKDLLIKYIRLHVFL